MIAGFMSMAKRSASMASPVRERWSDGDAYHQYVGRWSALVAREFVSWLDMPPASNWLDVGCGAGDVTLAILAQASPASVRGVDRSPDYVAHARQRVADARATFETGDAMTLDREADSSFDAAVAGLVINFLAEPDRAVRAMARATRRGGIVAAYVWDYADKIELIRYFWDAAVELFPETADQDEAIRFPLCNADGLARLWNEAGLTRVETRAIDVPTVFRDFDDFWSPFLGGQGPAPGFAMSLSEPDRAALRNLIGSRLPFHTDGSIHLIARAWAVRGTLPA